MPNKIILLSLILVALLSAAFFLRQPNPTRPTVTVYTAHDQDYSEPILNQFEQETGIQVKAIFDTEATKTTGLVNRLLAEKDNPQADVFWNNEVSRSIVLQRKGVLAPYLSPNAQDIPNQYKDPQGYWTGFGARARVLLINTNQVPNQSFPHTLSELTLPKWKGQIALANPLFGTTASHIAALYQVWGTEKAQAYLKALKANNLVIAESNGQVRDMVVNGEVSVGLTDSDDANDAVVDGAPVAVIYPDQAEGGTLIIPNTVALIKNAPHQLEARKLIDFLLSPATEQALAASKAAQMPLHANLATPTDLPSLKSIQALPVSWTQIADLLEISQKFAQEEFLR